MDTTEESINEWRRRLLAAGIASPVPFEELAFLCGRHALLGHEFPFGQRLASVLWSKCPPLGICLGIVIGFESAARRKMIAAT